MEGKDGDSVFLSALLALHSQLYKNLVTGKKVAEQRGATLDKLVLFSTVLLAGIDTTQKLGDKQLLDIQNLIDLNKQLGVLIEANNKQIDQFPILIRSIKQYKLDIESGESAKAARQRGGAEIEESML